MAKKKEDDPVVKHLQEVIVKALKQTTEGKGPGTERMVALARLTNVYLKAKGGRALKQGPSEETMSAAEWEAYCMEHGTPGVYEALCE